MKAFPVRLPSGDRYWTVLDDTLLPVPVVDDHLRHLRFGRDAAESTTKTYAHCLALFLRWCTRTNRDWRSAGDDLGMFILWLRHTPRTAAGSDPDPASLVVAVGPGVPPVRGGRRINLVLTAVRGLLLHAAASQGVPAVVSALYDVATNGDLPVELRDSNVAGLRLKAVHRVKAESRKVDRATDEEVVALLRACLSCRDRFIILLMARAGLRRSQVVGLRREDLHFGVDSSALGCMVERAHVHVVRRNNVNGAWSKSRRPYVIPVDHLLVQANDMYVMERGSCAQAADSDFVLVNLFREPLGTPMPPSAVNDVVTALVQRAGLPRHLTPHQLRHAFGGNVLDAGGTIDELQWLLGQASTRSTLPYQHPATDRLRAAIDRVQSPRLDTGEPW